MGDPAADYGRLNCSYFTSFAVASCCCCCGHPPLPVRVSPARVLIGGGAAGEALLCSGWCQWQVLQLEVQVEGTSGTTIVVLPVLQYFRLNLSCRRSATGRLHLHCGSASLPGQCQ